MVLPRLYAILDADLLQSRGLDLMMLASDLRSAGVTLFQYRNKTGGDRAILEHAALLRNALPAEKNLQLMLNDRADLAALSGCDGVHVGQEDLSAEEARKIVGPAASVGVSTHSIEQLMTADRTSCDYIAYGPVFPTASKQNHDPIVGLAALRMARSRTSRPLVAIGGIALENCRAVIDAGADSVAIISGLLPAGPGTGARQMAEALLARLCV